MEPDFIVAQSFQRVSSEKGLFSGPSLNSGQHLRQRPDDLRMEREIQILKPQRSFLFHGCPKQPHEPQCAVRDLLLYLPSPLRRQC